MAVLALREYERIHSGPVFDAGKRVVTAAQHHVLERFSEEYKRLHKVAVFQHGPRQSLVAQNFVGVINLGRDQVEVLPKIEGDDSQVRHNLVRMIATVMDLALLDDEASPTQKSNHSILEIFIRLFCEKLSQALRRGMVRRYESHSDNLTVLRGRLSVAQQIRHNLARPDRLACVFDEFTENNPLNQALKAALRVLDKVAQSQANQRHVKELLFCFQDVADVPPAALRWDQAATNRLSVKYKPLLALARMFVQEQSPDVVTGKGEGFALLFDMNELFERYIGIVARRVFSLQGYSVQLQGPKRHLAEHANGAPVFELRPDIVMGRADEVAFVIDTKWKRLQEDAHREGVTSADAYQMFAYAREYAAPSVTLLYPHHAALGAWVPQRAEYRLKGGSRQHIGVATVDLRNLGCVPAQLAGIFRVAEANLAVPANIEEISGLLCL